MIAVIRGPVYLFTYKVLKLTRKNERVRMEEGVHSKKRKKKDNFLKRRASMDEGVAAGS